MKSTVEKIILIVLGIVIFGYLYYDFYLSDQIVNITQLSKNIDSTKQVIQKLENEKVTVDSKIQQEKDLGSDINSAIPDNFDKKEIIKYFYELIKADGLKSDKVALTESFRSDYQSGTVSFKVTGTYDSIRNFMYQIENDKRKFVIKQANMGVDGDNYSSTMIVEFYALKRPVEKP